VAAVAESAGEVRSLGAVPYTEESIRRLVKRLSEPVIARELLGFVWAIGIQIEKEQRQPGRRRAA
jgi:hypothetical protein